MTHKIQSLLDKFAMSFSLICALHCLLTPILLLLLPAFASSLLASEAFHIGMLVVIVPTSLMALYVSCSASTNKHIIAWVVSGLLCLVVAILLEERFGDAFETNVTLLGALLVAIGHYKNFKQCRTTQTR